MTNCKHQMTNKSQKHPGAASGDRNTPYRLNIIDIPVEIVIGYI